MILSTSAVDLARRYAALRALLLRVTGITTPEAALALRVSRYSVMRMIDQLEASGERLIRIREGRRMRFRIQARPRKDARQLAIGELFALELARRSLGFLEGTGLRGYLDTLSEQFHQSLDRRRGALVRRFDQKIVWIDDAPTRYDDVADQVNEIVSALAYDRPLKIRFDKGDGKPSRVFRLDPYSLLVYKRGLYAVGRSHYHNEIRKFALDAIVEADQIQGETVRTPEDYDPRAEYRDAFGIIAGPLTDVHVRFDATVARHVLRRRWHHSEALTKRPDGSVDLRMRVAGTAELKNTLLSYGAMFEVVAPLSLRAEIAEIAARMAARHRMAE